MMQCDIGSAHGSTHSGHCGVGSVHGTVCCVLDLHMGVFSSFPAEVRFSAVLYYCTFAIAASASGRGDENMQYHRATCPMYGAKPLLKVGRGGF
jgi:hypothetical protein